MRSIVRRIAVGVGVAIVLAFIRPYLAHGAVLTPVYGRDATATIVGGGVYDEAYLAAIETTPKVVHVKEFDVDIGGWWGYGWKTPAGQSAEGTHVAEVDDHWEVVFPTQNASEAVYVLEGCSTFYNSGTAAYNALAMGQGDGVTKILGLYAQTYGSYWGSGILGRGAAWQTELWRNVYYYNPPYSGGGWFVLRPLWATPSGIATIQAPLVNCGGTTAVSNYQLARIDQVRDGITTTFTITIKSATSSAGYSEWAYSKVVTCTEAVTPSVLRLDHSPEAALMVCHDEQWVAWGNGYKSGFLTLVGGYASGYTTAAADIAKLRSYNASSSLRDSVEYGFQPVAGEDPDSLFDSLGSGTLAEWGRSFSTSASAAMSSALTPSVGLLLWPKDLIQDVGEAP